MATTSLPPLSSALLAAHHSGIREIANVAFEMPGAIRLEAGQPDFRTPAHVAEAAKAAIDAGFTFYTPTAGIMPLREAIARKLERVNGISVPPTQIACGPGGVGVIAATMATLVEAGDEVLTPDPGWPTAPRTWSSSPTSTHSSAWSRRAPRSCWSTVPTIRPGRSTAPRRWRGWPRSPAATTSG